MGDLPNEKLLKEYLASTTENTKELSIVDIGLNPQSKPLGDIYRSWEMGGVVTVALGNNVWAGGDNDADGTLSLHLAGTTVDVGGTTVAKSGKLSKAVMAAYRK